MRLSFVLTPAEVSVFNTTAINVVPKFYIMLMRQCWLCYFLYICHDFSHRFGIADILVERHLNPIRYLQLISNAKVEQNSVGLDKTVYVAYG